VPIEAFKKKRFPGGFLFGGGRGKTPGGGAELDHTPSQLSGGNQTRVVLHGSLVNNHGYDFLADEATGNLDTRTSRNYVFVFKNLKNKHYITFWTPEQDIEHLAIETIVLKRKSNFRL